MGNVPSARTFVVGEVETAAYLNSVSAAVNFLLNPPRAKAYPAANVSLNSAAYTAIPFDAEVYDTDGIHSTSASNTRFTAQTPGMYHVIAQGGFQANGTGIRLGQIKVNGGSNPVAQCESQPNGSYPVTVNCEADVYLAAGDYVEFIGYQSSGAALNMNAGVSLTTYMSVRWVAAS